MSDCYECANSTGWGVCQHCNGKDPKGELLGEDSNSTSTYDPDAIPFKTPPTFADRHSKTIELCTAFAILTIILYFTGTYYYSRPSIEEKIKEDMSQLYKNGMGNLTSDYSFEGRVYHQLVKNKTLEYYYAYTSEYEKTILANGGTKEDIQRYNPIHVSYSIERRFLELVELASRTQGVVPSKLSDETLMICTLDAARQIAVSKYN